MLRVILRAFSPRTVACILHDALAPLGITCHRALLRGLIEIVYYVGVGLGFGLRSFYYYATGPGMHYNNKSSDILGYPEIAGFATGITVLGSALSFLLVFRLSWSFSHWYEARGLIGQSMTSAREIALLLKVESPALKLCYSSIASELCRDDDAVASPSPRKQPELFFRRRRGLSMTAASIQEIHADASEQEVNKLEPGRARKYGRSRRRVLLCASWIQDSIRNRLDSNEQLVALQHVDTLVAAYYSMMKIKKTTAPPAIQLLVFILKTTYCLCLYPQFLAYAFVMKLNDDQRTQQAIVRNWYFPVFYATITTLGIIYFIALHIIALELDDPFGDDISDFPLEKWALALFEDLDDIAQFYDDDDGDQEVSEKVSSLRMERDKPVAAARTFSRRPSKSSSFPSSTSVASSICDPPVYHSAGFGSPNRPTSMYKTTPTPLHEEEVRAMTTQEKDDEGNDEDTPRHAKITCGGDSVSAEESSWI